MKGAPMRISPYKPATKTTMAQIFDDIGAKRVKQLAKGYDAAHDDKHGYQQLADASAAYASNLQKIWPWMDGFKAHELPPRDRLLEAAAMLFAAIESHDRTEGVQ